MKITTQHVPDDCDYLTPGKEYEVILESYRLNKHFKIIDDDGDEIFIIIGKSDRLDGKSWEVIKDKEID